MKKSTKIWIVISVFWLLACSLYALNNYEFSVPGNFGLRRTSWSNEDWVNWMIFTFVPPMVGWSIWWIKRE